MTYGRRSWPGLNRASWQPIAVLLLGGAVFGCSDEDGPDSSDLPDFSEESLTMGALLCLTGPASARVPSLDKALILAEEFINGSSRVYTEDEAEIPCRMAGNCGVWVGRDGAGNDLRGPIRFVVADSEERPVSASNSARRLREVFDVPAMMVGCSSPVVERVFEDVTGTDALLVSPIVSADSMSLLPDRNDQELESGSAGWVYRTVTPDYVIAKFLGQVGLNVLPSRPLVRFEDETDAVCENDDECEELGPGFACRPSVQSATPEREFINITDRPCADEATNFCDSLGRNYVCEPLGPDGLAVCAQFRSRKFCTRETSPRAAMILHEDSAFGRSLRDEVRGFWEVGSGGQVVATVAFDPSDPESFGNRVSALFLLGEAEFRDQRAAGNLAEDAEFGDSVVFLFADAVDGTLLMQEWSSQLGSFGVRGAESVFWLGTDLLRNRILTNNLTHDTVRNLYVISSSVLDSNNGGFFEQMYRRRWRADPPEFAAHVFDTALLLALANERAAFQVTSAETAGRLGPVAAAPLKNAFPEVAGGCYRPNLTDRCLDLLGEVPTTVRPLNFQAAMSAARSGEHVVLTGTTGDLSMSPAGDRISELELYKVERASGGKGRFFPLERFSPQFFGVSLER